MRREQEQHPEGAPRPRSITIFGPEGKPLKSIVVRSLDGEPEERNGGELPKGLGNGEG
jgi:hypothetical protein